MAMGYNEFGKLIESGDTEAVAKVFNAMEGQAQQLMLSYLTDKQLEKLNSMLDSSGTDDDLNMPEKYGESITGSNDEQPDTGINVQSLSLDDLWNNINDFGMVGEDSDDFTKNEWNKLIEAYDMAVENIARSDPDKLVEHLLHKGFSGNALGRAAHEVIDEYHPDYEIDESRFGPVYAEDDGANPNDKLWLNEWLSKHHYVDTNGDGDTDVITADTDDNGEPDTAVVAGDDAKEEKDAVKAAKEDLGLDGDDDTSTGKKKKELDAPDESTLSDARFKNICLALLDNRF